MKIKNLLLLLLLLLSTTTYSQVQWTKYSSQPVLSMDTTYMWASYGQPTCIFQGDTFRMWYAVAGGVDPFDTVPRGRIFYAWSLDGFNWNEYADNPVLDIGNSGDWDDEWLDTPEILWDGSEYKLYYYGDSTYFQGQDNTALGLATSPDGIHFTRQGIVLQRGNPDEWDGEFIESPAAYYDPASGIHAIIYTGQDTIGWIRLGLAVSPDGFNWIKWPLNPILSPGISGSWDDMFVAVPALIRTGDIFEMWYSGVPFIGQFDSVFVGYAVSVNGTDWIKYPGNPVLKVAPGDSGGFWAVDIVWDTISDQYLMWYEDGYKSGSQAIYLATAPRTILNSPLCNTSISPDTIIYSGDSVVLTAAGGDYYQWDPSYGLSNIHIASPVAYPDTTITYKVMIMNDSCIKTEYVQVNVLPLNIDNEHEIITASVFPNPFRNRATISIPYSNENEYKLIIFNSLGSMIDQPKTFRGNKTVIEQDNMAKGLYIFTISHENYQIAKGKFIIE